MTSSPRVSVVIPCFNLGRFVDEAVDSVLEQTYRDYELLIVDDGSTDTETLERLDALGRRPGIAIVRSENRGLSAARNLGIAHSRGDYICTLDADDRLRPTWLAEGASWLDADPGVAFVSHWALAFGDRSFTWAPVRCDVAALLDSNTVNGAALFRRTLVDAIGGFDESMTQGCEDWDFWIRATASGHTGVIVPRLLYDYRQRADSMSRSMMETDVYARLYEGLVEKHRSLFEAHLIDLVLRRDWTFGDVCRRVDGLESEVRLILEPAIEQRERELALATATLADVRAERARARAREEAIAARQELEQAYLAAIDASDRAERRAEAAERRAGTAERRAETAERHAETAERHAETAERRAGTAERHADTAERRAETAEQHTQIVASRLAEVEHAEVALRASWSWRVTAPLRRLRERMGLGGRSVYDR